MIAELTVTRCKIRRNARSLLAAVREQIAGMPALSKNELIGD